MGIHLQDTESAAVCQKEEALTIINTLQRSGEQRWCSARESNHQSVMALSPPLSVGR
jgi:hypothetical protein